MLFFLFFLSLTKSYHDIDEEIRSINEELYNLRNSLKKIPHNSQFYSAISKLKRIKKEIREIYSQSKEIQYDPNFPQKGLIAPRPQRQTNSSHYLNSNKKVYQSRSSQLDFRSRPRQIINLNRSCSLPLSISVPAAAYRDSITWVFNDE